MGHRAPNVVLALCATTSLLVAGCGGGSSQQAISNTGEQAAQGGQTVGDAVADQRADQLVQSLTLSQKIQLVHGQGLVSAANTTIAIGYDMGVKGALGGPGYVKGIPELGIPDLNMVDSTSGVLVVGTSATALPSTSALAATWSPELANAFGQRIGKDLRDMGFAVGLGGSINLARDPRFGRSFENMGEDPVLAGELAAERTIGVQSRQVVSTIKHFAFNNYDTNRYIGNSVVDEQTMRETEMLGFEIAIQKGKPGYVMCAYNQVNGTYACENTLLLSTLKNEWGFKGMVQSDWGAAASTVAAANAGLDEEQPSQKTDDQVIPSLVKFIATGPYFINALSQAVSTGAVPVARLDDMVRRKLRTLVQIGVLDNPPKPGTVDEPGGRQDALRVARASMTLLKNAVPAGGSSPVLPLQPGSSVSSIVVIGGHADKGVLSGGGAGGVVAVNGNAVESCLSPAFALFGNCATWVRSAPLDAIRAKYPGATVKYFEGDDAPAAAAAAEVADVAIVFATQFESEGVDLASMSLSSPKTNSENYSYDQDALISAVAAKAKRTVVVIESGGAVAMPWIGQVHGVLAAWYPGIAGGQAIADVIAGDFNPAGKLPMTFPIKEADLPQAKMPTNLGALIGSSILPRSLASIVKNAMGAATFDALRTVNYSEKLLLGYKWFDAKNIVPLFHFGHGLSYSTFVYSDLSAASVADGSVSVRFTLRNNSNRAGTEVAQVYASLPSGIAGNEQPPKRLVGWSRVELGAGESKTISVVVPKKYLSTWNVTSHKWQLNPGSYQLIVAPSADTNATLNVLRQGLLLSAS